MINRKLTYEDLMRKYEYGSEPENRKVSLRAYSGNRDLFYNIITLAKKQVTNMKSENFS